MEQLMLDLCELAPDDVVEVEFDEYVPVTVTWEGARRLLEQPVYVTCVAGSTMLELKFDPSSHRLIEAVLVNAPRIRREPGSLIPSAVGEPAVVCWSGSDDGDRLDLSAGMEVVARDNCLLVALSAEPAAEWRGSSPVLYGRGRSGDLVSLCVLWDDAARELVLGPA